MVWLYCLSIVLGGIVPVSADDFFSPPALDPQPPPWIQDAENAANGDGSDSTGDQNSMPQPSEGPPPGFWGDDDDSEGDSDFAPSPRGSSVNAKPKNSFQMTEPWNDVLGDETKSLDCLGWGHAFLGVMMFQNESSCDFMLSQKIEKSKQDIRSLEDHTRSMILREVIKGKISRESSKKFKLQYDLLLDTLFEAQNQGCRCLE